ncbi:MAG: hypothetical protein RLZZ584_1385 [Pseudomonadota bacterium]
MSAVLPEAATAGLTPDAARLLQALTRAGVMPAAELLEVLGKSQPTLSRVLRELGGRVVALGAARARRYGVPQSILGLPARRPLTWVDEHGVARPWGALTLLAGDQVHVSGPGVDVITRGALPWFLAPLRVEGHLGRIIAAELAPLGLDSRPERWTLAEQLYAAALLHDAPGALVLGELPGFAPPLLTTVLGPAAATAAPAARPALLPALQAVPTLPVSAIASVDELPPDACRLLPAALAPLLAAASAAAPPLPLRRRQADVASRCALYDRLADENTPPAAALPDGACLPGEQPKFLCRLTDGGAEVVKYSPPLGPMGGAWAERWSDLLHAELTALAVLGQAGLPVAEAELLISPQRVYLVTQRVDRLPAPRVAPAGVTEVAGAGVASLPPGPRAAGRRHLVSLATAHRAFVAGPLRDATGSARALAEQRRLCAADAQRISLLQAYAQLVGHGALAPAKLALAVDAGDVARGRLALAPLTTLRAERYTPTLLGGEPPLTPLQPDARALHSAARPWAELTWQTMADSDEFSPAWRALARVQAQQLRAPH